MPGDMEADNECMEAESEFLVANGDFLAAEAADSYNSADNHTALQDSLSWYQRSLDQAADEDEDDEETGSGLYYSNYLALDDLTQLIEEHTYALGTVNAPLWFISKDLRAICASQQSYTSVAMASPLAFAPGLLEVITAPTPPDSSFFSTLPLVDHKAWAIYLIYVVKDGCVAVYIGSGTAQRAGYWSRLAHYTPGHNLCPQGVQEAFDEGYTIKHRGRVCWSDTISEAGWAPRVRARLLLLEAMFPATFWAVRESTGPQWWGCKMR
jgi:hypothetical protein